MCRLENCSQIRDWRKASLAPPHISTMRGSTSRRVAGIVTAVLLSLLLFTVVPALLFLPQATTEANGGEDNKQKSSENPITDMKNVPAVQIHFRTVVLRIHS